VQVLTAAFESREQEQGKIRDRNPKVAIQRAIWSPSHNEKEMSVTDIATRVTAIIRSLGGNDEFNARQIGWQLRGLRPASRGK